MRIEEEYQNLVAEYLDGLSFMDETIKFTAIEPSLYLGSQRQVRRKKNMGVRPGFPDLMICIPPILFFLEMKTEETTLTEEQPNVFPIIQQCNVPVLVAHDPLEAIEQINKILEQTGRNNFL